MLVVVVVAGGGGGCRLWWLLLANGDCVAVFSVVTVFVLVVVRWTSLIRQVAVNAVGQFI